MIILNLPVSGNVVEIRESITYGEYQEIENFVKNRLKLRFVGQEQTTEIDGSVDQQMHERMIQLFLHSCKGPNNEEISTLGLLNRLDVEDGQIIDSAIAEKYKEIKKKLAPNPA